MGQKKRKAANWSDIRSKLKEMDCAELMGLVQDLFNFSPDNRDFLAARYARNTTSTAPIEEYRRKIIAAFRDADGNPELGIARKAIRDYEKASADLQGTLHLMLTYVETGTDFTREYGDMYEEFYDSLCSVLDAFAKRVRTKDGQRLLEMFGGKLGALAEKANGIGWGYGDYVCDVVHSLIRKSI